MPYDLTPQFLDDLLKKHHIDYVIHGDDPCILPGETFNCVNCRMMRLPILGTLRSAASVVTDVRDNTRAGLSMSHFTILPVASCSQAPQLAQPAQRPQTP